jgi:hypothetical protein
VCTASARGAGGPLLYAEYCQKNWIRASPPVKYAKFFAERYVAQEIAVF